MKRSKLARLASTCLVESQEGLKPISNNAIRIVGMFNIL